MEIASVSATPGHVPVLDDQWVSPDAAKGAFFDYQWEAAEKAAPPILLVTGWNEWTASVWETPGVVMLGRKTEKGQGHIVDEFNAEFNRDLEPVRNSYGDNYYLQFVAQMRRYKGTTAPEPASPPKTITIDGRFADWQTVRPVYRDPTGETAPRDWDATIKGIHYTNHSGRNDLAAFQVTRDARSVYFHVHLADAPKPGTEQGGLWLLVDADDNPATGWLGYDLLMGRTRKNNRVSVERSTGKGWGWKHLADAPVRFGGADGELSLPRTLLPASFAFKWTDHLPAIPTVLDLYTEGDVAPDARFNYHWSGDAAASPTRHR